MPPVDDADEEDLDLYLNTALVLTDDTHLSDEARMTAESLLSIGAFAENNHYALAVEFDQLGLDDLLQTGMVDVILGDGERPMYAMNLSCVRISGSSICCNPFRILQN